MGGEEYDLRQVAVTVHHQCLAATILGIRPVPRRRHLALHKTTQHTQHLGCTSTTALAFGVVSAARSPPPVVDPSSQQVVAAQPTGWGGHTMRAPATGARTSLVQSPALMTTTARAAAAERAAKDATILPLNRASRRRACSHCTMPDSPCAARTRLRSHANHVHVCEGTLDGLLVTCNPLQKNKSLAKGLRPRALEPRNVALQVAAAGGGLRWAAPGVRPRNQHALVPALRKD